MGDDLKDAVLRAFGEQEQAPSEAPKANDAEDAEDAEEASAAAKSAARPGAKMRTAAATAAKRTPAGAPRPAATRTDVPVAPEPRGSGGPARPPTAQAGRPAGGGQPGRGLLLTALVLCLALLLLSVVLLGQVVALKTAVGSQQEQLQKIAAQLVEIRGFSRVKLAAYAESGKRPQRVLCVMDVVDGKLRLTSTEIRPLEEP